MFFLLREKERGKETTFGSIRTKEAEEGNRGEKCRKNCKETKKLCFSMQIHAHTHVVSIIRFRRRREQRILPGGTTNNTHSYDFSPTFALSNHKST